MTSASGHSAIRIGRKSLVHGVLPSLQDSVPRSGPTGGGGPPAPVGLTWVWEGGLSEGVAGCGVRAGVVGCAWVRWAEWASGRVGIPAAGFAAGGDTESTAERQGRRPVSIASSSTPRGNVGYSAVMGAVGV